MALSARQAQCLANIHAVLKHYRMPQPVLLKAEQDRCWFGDSMGFVADYHARLKGVHFTNHRENVARFAMELTFHPAGHIEIDFDLYNPHFGAGVALCHMAECAWNFLRRRKTDPFVIARGLAKRGIEGVL